MPYPNEHACRLQPPGKFDEFARKKRKASNGKVFSVIYGIFQKAGKRTSAEQAYRYPKGSWTAAEARAHCKDHGGSFEAASTEMIEDNPLIPDGPDWPYWGEKEKENGKKEK